METDARHWQHAAKLYGDGRYMDPELARHIRDVYLALLRRWAPQLDNPRILKTDAFADATWPARAFTWSIHEAGLLVCYDIAPGMTTLGKRNAAALGRPDTAYVTADARLLPFDNEAFDLIVSDSTLDHFHTTDEIMVALREHARVLKRGGVMVIALDNPHNVTEPLFRLWLRYGPSPYFIGKTLTKAALVTSLEGVGLEVTDITAILHYPRLVTKSFLRLLRWTAPRRGDALARAVLALLNRLERCPLRYCTGLFVAARAVKPL